MLMDSELVFNVYFRGGYAADSGEGGFERCEYVLQQLDGNMVNDLDSVYIHYTLFEIAHRIIDHSSGRPNSIFNVLSKGRIVEGGGVSNGLFINPESKMVIFCDPLTSQEIHYLGLRINSIVKSQLSDSDSIEIMLEEESLFPWRHKISVDSRIMTFMSKP